MKTFSMFLFAPFVGLVLSACAVDSDEPDPVTGEALACQVPLIDEDGDGTPDGVDFDCDGVIDIAFEGGDGGTNECSTTVIINDTKKEIACASENGGLATCECRLNDELVDICTIDGSGCSIGVPGANCCGF
jgi:hypothetical protein